ncbi:MAG: hypothetical protein H7281_16460 [Bacteriovorax sp.]|nr:hypothetical protein [Bacteriovorax sp.]
MAKQNKNIKKENVHRWTDKSNQYEHIDKSEQEPPNSVFPFEKKKNGKNIINKK